MEKNNKYINWGSDTGRDFWRDFPEELKQMLIVMFTSGGEYCENDVMKYLQNNKADRFTRNGNAKFNYLRWAERFFSQMYPLYTYEDAWEDYAEELKDILDTANGYLHDLIGDEKLITDGYLSEFGYNDDNDLVKIAQRLELYYATLYWYMGDMDRFRLKIRKILEDTKNNICHALYHEDAEELIDIDYTKGDEYYTLDFDYWQPISWLYHAARAGQFDQSISLLYEEYVDFLYSIRENCNAAAWTRVTIRAEECLQFLYSLAEDFIFELDSSGRQIEYWLNELIGKIAESEIRVAKLKETTEAVSEAEDDHSDDDTERR